MVNTLVLGVGSATVVTALALVVAYLSSAPPGARAPRAWPALAMAPIAVPGHRHGGRRCSWSMPGRPSCSTARSGSCWSASSRWSCRPASSRCRPPSPACMWSWRRRPASSAPPACGRCWQITAPLLRTHHRRDLVHRLHRRHPRVVGDHPAHHLQHEGHLGRDLRPERERRSRRHLRAGDRAAAVSSPSSRSSPASRPSASGSVAHDAAGARAGAAADLLELRRGSTLSSLVAREISTLIVAGDFSGGDAAERGRAGRPASASAAARCARRCASSSARAWPSASPTAASSSARSTTSAAADIYESARRPVLHGRLDPRPRYHTTAPTRPARPYRHHAGRRGRPATPRPITSPTSPSMPPSLRRHRQRPPEGPILPG